MDDFFTEVFDALESDMCNFKGPYGMAGMDALIFVLFMELIKFLLYKLMVFLINFLTIK